MPHARADSDQVRGEAGAAARRSPSRTALLQSITAALSRALTPDDVAHALVERGLDAMGAQEAGLWAEEPGGGSARLLHAVGFTAASRARFQSIPLVPGSGVPLVDAVRSGEPIYVESRLAAAARYPSLEAWGVGLHLEEYAFACVPLEAEGRCLGAVSFTFHAARAFEEEERVFLVVLARLAAQALARARLYASERAARAEAEAAERRARFLAEASALLASSLGWEETVASVARLAVAGVADWCSVEVPESLVAGGAPVVVAHVDPAKVEMARQWRLRLPPDPNAPSGAPAVMRTGRSELYEDVPDALLVALARSEEELRIARELRMTSAMVVPLSARGRTLGALSLIAAQPGRRYGPADLAMAEELGRRAGVAMDNARLYAEAQRAVRLRDDVLAVVSHDLKNPLEAALLSASLLLRNPESQRVQRHAETVRRSAARMDRLIRELLDLSSMEAGRFRVEARPERLEDVVEETLAVLAPLASEKDVALDASGGPLEAPVPCDRERILQVLSNLVGNALQFTPPGGHVALRLALGAAEARVEVRDDGPGIPPAALPHVFDRFWKSGSRGGTGLGLSIAKGIVEAHGGRIGVETRPGAGSTFWFTLPRGAERASWAPASAPSP